MFRGSYSVCLATAFVLFYYPVYFFESRGSPSHRVDTTPPTLEISLVPVYVYGILSESPTEVRIKAGTECFVVPLPTDDFGIMQAHLEFKGRKYNWADHLVVPDVPGTYTAYGYARDEAGNETRVPFNIIVVDDEESEKEIDEETPGDTTEEKDHPDGG